jgi:hypothetical protein
MQIGNNTTHDTEETVAYQHRGLLYVPHYLKPNTYVAPGGKTYSLPFLKKKGAVSVTLFLWPRKWQTS